MYTPTPCQNSTARYKSSQKQTTLHLLALSARTCYAKLDEATIDYAALGLTGELVTDRQSGVSTVAAFVTPAATRPCDDAEGGRDGSIASAD